MMEKWFRTGKLLMGWPLERRHYCLAHWEVSCFYAFWTQVLHCKWCTYTFTHKPQDLVPVISRVIESRQWNRTYNSVSPLNECHQGKERCEGWEDGEPASLLQWRRAEVTASSLYTATFFLEKAASSEKFIIILMIQLHYWMVPYMRKF